MRDPDQEERDRFVLERLLEKCLSVAFAMAGGYARKSDDTVEIPLQTVRRAALIAGPFAECR